MPTNFLYLASHLNNRKCKNSYVKFICKHKDDLKVTFLSYISHVNMHIQIKHLKHLLNESKQNLFITDG